jgi:hypothetical protein
MRLNKPFAELHHTDGFFFGASDGTEIDDDLRFIRKAREAIAAGHKAPRFTRRLELWRPKASLYPTIQFRDAVRILSHRAENLKIFRSVMIIKRKASGVIAGLRMYRSPIFECRKL